MYIILEMPVCVSYGITNHLQKPTNTPIFMQTSLYKCINSIVIHKVYKAKLDPLFHSFAIKKIFPFSFCSIFFLLLPPSYDTKICYDIYLYIELCMYSNVCVFTPPPSHFTVSTRTDDDDDTHI